MVDKSMWFFFLLFHPFIHSSFIALWFFSFGLQKELFFQIVICRFLLLKLQLFCLFSLMRGILMIQSYLLMFFRFLHLRGRFLKFSIVYFLLMMFVEVKIEVEDSYEMLMYGITSWNIFSMFLVYLILLSTWRWLLLILHEFVELLVSFTTLRSVTTVCVVKTIVIES
jgi:hypothetical protein